MSIRVCITSNRGNAVRITHTMAISRSGMTTPRTTASLGFIMIAMIRPPISIPGARRSMRSPIAMTFCIFVISFVSLVTSEPVENFSIFAKENSCTFVNTSPRSAAAKFADALTAKYAPSVPPAIMHSARSTMISPFKMI